jgi:hypothetical protein
VIDHRASVDGIAERSGRPNGRIGGESDCRARESGEQLRELGKEVASYARSAFESTSVVSIAKFGVCSEKVSVSDDVQHQIEQTHDRLITNVIDVSNNDVVATGVSASVCGERLDEIVSSDNVV